MDVKQIQELIQLISQTELAEVKIEIGDFKLSVRTKEYLKAVAEKQYIQVPTLSAAPVAPASFSPAATAPATGQSTINSPSQQPAVSREEEPVVAAKLLEIRSPMVGTFYRAASPEKPPYIKVGDSVSAGTVVCIVEAMKLFNEIESEISGKVVKVLVNDASPVEYDQVLFLVEPNA